LPGLSRLPTEKSKTTPCTVDGLNGIKGLPEINRSNALALYLEVGSRSQDDLIACSDIDMMSPASGGPVPAKDGTPSPDNKRPQQLTSLDCGATCRG
jgi:hypothetical protein